MSESVTIYALRDPRSGAVRYVGKTVRALKQRLKDHLSAARCREHGETHRHRWLRQLLAEGLTPEIEVLEETGKALWQECERHWIAYAKDQGWPLTNATVGGDGTEGLSSEARQKISEASKGNQKWLGRTHSQESRDKMSRAAMGRPSAFKGHSHTEANKAKFAEVLREYSRGEHNTNAKLMLEDVENIQCAYAEGGITQWELARQYGVRQAAISAILRGTAWADHHVLAEEQLRAVKAQNYRVAKHGKQGEAHHSARLTAEQVMLIRQERMQGAPLRTLAERYGVAESTISRIASCKRWKHIH